MAPCLFISKDLIAIALFFKFLTSELNPSNHAVTFWEESLLTICFDIVLTNQLLAEWQL